MNQAIQKKGLSTIALATLLLIAVSFLIVAAPRKAVVALLAWSGLQSMAAYWGLTWALPRSDKAFFSIFVGDALLRLVVLGLAVYFLYVTRTPFVVPLLSLAMGYLILSLVQIPFLHRLPS